MFIGFIYIINRVGDRVMYVITSGEKFKTKGILLLLLK